MNTRKCHVRESLDARHAYCENFNIARYRAAFASSSLTASGKSLPKWVRM
jgi:hypothetical protein